MAYFEDFSDYSYHTTGIRPGTKNIGWLEPKCEFEKASPTEDILDILWDFCKISVVQMRGLHLCNLCDHQQPRIVERNHLKLLLGSAEIRVFSENGDIYAAPNLIYHYVVSHSYKLPDRFIKALATSVRPSAQEYFDKLENLKLEWSKTLVPH